MAIQLNHRHNRITTGSNAENAGVVLEVFNTGALILPKGVDADRVAATEVAGAFRFNTTSLTLEYYNGTIWVQIVGGFTEDLRGANGEFIVDGVNVGAGAVNYTEITNATTGNGVTIESAGSDADVDMGIAAKGAGEVTVGTGAGDVATFAGGGAAAINVNVDGTDADVTTTGNLNLIGNIVNIYDNTNKVAEFRHNGGDNALLVEAVTSGVLISVSGAAPSELFFGQKINMNGNSITNMADPVAAQDAATKAYVDAAINGLDWKNSVRAASTVNIDLTTGGLLTVDGVTLVAGDRVLVKDQTDKTENGIYVAAAGSWARAEDANNLPGNEVSGGMATFVTEGTANNGTAWVMTSPSGDATLGSDNLVFAQFAAPGSLNIIGGSGINSSQNGVNWTIDADVDNVTIFALGGTGSQLAVKSTDTVGQVLRSTGTATDAAVWGALDLANADAVTGTLALTNGGTGLATIAARSVLVANTADTLVALQADASRNQILRWNNTGSTYEFVDQSSVGGISFETITPSGNGNATSVAADSTGDTLSVVGGAGIAIDGDAGLTTLTFAQTLSGLAAVGTVAGGDTVTIWQGGSLGTTTFTDVIADLDLVTIPGASIGMLAQTADGVFAARTIEAATSADQVGIVIVDGGGVAGNPTVGLDLAGLPTTAIEGTDFVVFYDGSGDANAKVAVTDLLAFAADKTRINDSADTTYVDTDEVAGRVVVAANDGTVAEFVGSSLNSDFFVFNTATSAGTIRMEASGASADIDIRIIPKGAGEVFIGYAGDGVIQADDTFNLTVAGGDNGGDLILKGGTTGGEVLVQNDAGDKLVTFGADNTLTHYAATSDSFSKDYVLRFATTGTGSDAENIAIPANGTVLLEGYIVARETSLATTDNHAGYKFRAVVYNTGGAATILDSVVEEIVAESPAALQVAVTVNAANAVVTVTGATGVNMTWTGFVKVVTVVS